MQNDTCPICGRDGALVVGAIAGRDAQMIRCPRCGEFGFDAFVPRVVQNDFAGKRHLLSYAIRMASDRGQKLTIVADDLSSLVSLAPTYRTISDGVDLFLLHLSTKAKRYTAQIDLNAQIDYSLVPTRDDTEYVDLYALAGEMGFVDVDSRRITVEGWKRLDELRSASREHRQAFVAMWFDDGMSEVWEQGFVPGISRSEYYRPFRIDRKEHNNKIDDEIVAEIRRSGLLIADFTGDRGGVYFEAGLAQGLGIPVIWTCRRSDIGKVHFDTRQYSHILWDSAVELADALDKRIRATVLPVGFQPTT